MGNSNWIVRVYTVFNQTTNEDVLLQQMSGTEELGRPFRYELRLYSVKGDLKLDDQLGKAIAVEFTLANNTKRYFHGLVSEMSFVGSTHGPSQKYYVYDVVLRPWFWFLSNHSDNRVLQQKTVYDIFVNVCKESAGFNDFKKSLTGTYPSREYCVQYGETDFDFVSRLLEEEGIYYFFEHEKTKHTLVLADGSSAHQPIPGNAKVPFRAPGEATADLEHISHWRWTQRVETTEFALNSYDFEKPRSNLAASSEISRQHALAGFQQYEYGRLYKEKADGDNLAKVRAAEQQVDYAKWTGYGEVMALSLGSKFSLIEHPQRDQNAEYLVVGVAYELHNGAIEAFADEESSFNVSFTATKPASQFRPARTTPKAVVRGPQTAVVVGKSGEEIWVDKYGRVKIQFHWDREGKKDENSSCWVRVSTALAGKKWGFVAIPRIGQEVIVDFLEGDPDQPIITGSVYNADHMVPYDLPANQTQSGLKTRSTKEGAADNFNELRFEDKKGAEEVFFHAEKDFKRVVKNNDTLEVGLETKDKGDQKITIHNDRKTTLNEGSDTLIVEKKDHIIKVNSGDQNIKVKKKITIEAGDEVIIKVGQSKLVMTKLGDITMNGVKMKFDSKNTFDVKANNSVKINGTAKVEASSAMIKIAGSAKTDITGAMTKVAGTAMLDLSASGMAKLKGSLTMIG